MANKSNKKKKETKISGFTPERKVEVLGIIIIGIAILMGISIISYAQQDYQFAQNNGFFSLFKSDTASRMVNNWLGPVGAYISHFFVYKLFGYASIILAILVGYLGWNIFRHRNIHQFTWISTLSLWAMVLLSAVLGWLNSTAGFPSNSIWSGATGLTVAEILQNFTSVIGSGIILLLFLIITIVLFIDRDLQKTIDNMSSWIRNFKEKRAAKKELKEIQKEERKLQKQQQKEIKQAQKQKKEERPIKETVVEKEETRTEPEASLYDKYVATPSIDEIVEKSEEEERKRKEQEELEVKGLDQRPRALLDKEETAEDDEDDIEVAVYKGEGDEQADEREFDKINKDKAKEVPVIKYKFPTIDLLDAPPENRNEVDLEEIKENKRVILDKLKRHKIEIVAINAIVGPTVTLYELEPAPDVKISKIESYANDLKMATASRGLRMLAPIPGKSAVGIEVPNNTRETVYIKQVINTKKFMETDMVLPVAFGKTIENEVFMIDLTKMPHLLMAGATGSGKSVGINTIITCLLYKANPSDLKFVLIDPKKIELALYRNIQNHFLAMLPNAEEPIVTDTSKAQETLESVCKEMDDRYDLLKMALVRDIKAYNEKFKNGELDSELGHRHLPYIVVVIDELADLMMTAGKQIEEPIARLAQLARAIGIHLVVATQRPSVNVITGTIKANFPARIAYQVASKVDSRTIIDVGGADQLVGRGDMLFASGAGMTRVQNAFVSTEEVERINTFIGQQVGFKEPFYLPVIQEDNSGIPDPLDDIDDMFETAAKLVILYQQGSVSLLQRKLKIGYNRAGRIIDQLFNAGIVGPHQGSTARDVLISTEEELQEILDDLDNL